MEEEAIIAIVVGGGGVFAMFIALPWMFFHYITKWREQKTLKPDDEKIMEDLWRSAKRMERRIETLEALIESEGETRSARHPTETDYRRDS